MRSLGRPARRPERRPARQRARELARGLVDRVRDRVSYSPRRDGRPDPGEVVWGWVAFDEDPARGKDRPVLVIGRRGERLLGLMLTSQDHDLDAEDEARWGRYWMDVGSGDWDRDRRPSEVRLDRLLVLEERSVRREGGTLPRPVFDQVIAAAREFHPLES